ncbi:hypothetical protein IE81DRAFT_250545 [Ceraceosorus guamensis]|uniref:Smr domain-containing protein n=1 Tax=Ceraceosorus guamensis TaxID=1522189 RepID=A0A316W469_9BASI|nr:hypothetical protein IE81DRAFT_250545 [Ceraceosorus guamensis]PWN44640.1 hypothetical protein IE81DRAFT_250545 [Ceraceosorus guamensis]
MADIQAKLEPIYVPAGLDSSLVAAICHEPEQTEQTAREVLSALLDAALCSPVADLELAADDKDQSNSTSSTSALEESQSSASGSRKPFGRSGGEARSDDSSIASFSTSSTVAVDARDFLRHALPEHSEEALKEALRRTHGDVEAAVEALLAEPIDELRLEQQAESVQRKDWNELGGQSKQKKSAKKRQANGSGLTSMEGPVTVSGSSLVDNTWVLTSSVQAQLSLLLDLPDESVQKALRHRSRDLSSAATEVVESEAGKITLSGLDESGGAPPGTAQHMVESIAVIRTCTLPEAELAFRATKGRQDSAIDLLELMSGLATHEATSSSHKLVPPIFKPAQSGASSVKTKLGTLRGSTAFLPASNTPASTTSVGGSSNAPANKGAYSSTECRDIAANYRLQREEALRKASSTYRRVGPAAAWYYADTARELEAKARIWNMRAAHELISERKTKRAQDVSGYGALSTGVGIEDEIDLHMLSLHEALDVTRKALQEWNASNDFVQKRADGTTQKRGLKIITGVGNHSVNRTPILRPGIKRMLEREGWDAQEQHGAGSGTFIVRGRAKI